MHRRPSLVLSAVTFALVTAFAAGAGAQGTMTPTQPPPSPPAPAAEPAPTPTQPPVVQQATPAQGASTSEVPPDEHASGEAPPARTGFQISLRTGVAVPLGDAAQDAKMSDGFGLQVPIIADIGAKVIPQLFVGGYLGIAVGGVGDSIKKSCDQVKVDCSSVGFRFGVEAQYHILPDGKLNPWVGYGIGYEISGIGGSKNNDKVTFGLGGVEFAHLMAGFDYRVSKVFGIGPFADFALGQYSVTTSETTLNGVTKKTDSDISNKAMHEWLMLGVKVTFFP
jgi:hypothetical protein